MRGLRFHAWGALASLAFATLGCTRDPLPPQGEIVLVINTDVAIPDAIDTLRLEILGSGALGFSGDYPIGPGQNLIPATFGVLQNDDPSKSASIRLIGRKNGAAKMLREVVTTIPSERVVSLRMPIRWLCDDTASDVGAPSATGKRCPTGQTCIGGDCYGREVEGASLERFDPGELSTGACFDVVSCMSSGVSLQIDPATCTTAKPADTRTLNIALKVKGDGICDATKTSCYVVLDRQTTPGPLDGWRENGDRIELAQEVCRRLSSTPPRIDAVVASTTCPSKPPSLATCGPWLATPSSGGPTVPGAPDAGAPSPVETVLFDLGSANPGGHAILPVESMPYCEVRLVGTRVVFCSLEPLPSRRGVVRAVELSTLSASVLAEEAEPTFLWGPFYGPGATLAVARPNRPGGGVTLETFDAAAGASTGKSATTAALDEAIAGIDDGLDFSGAADAAGVYLLPVDGATDTRSVSRIDRRTGAATELAVGISRLPLFRAIAADADASGFVYTASSPQAAGSSRVERVSKTAVRGALARVADVPTSGIQDLRLAGPNLYVIGYDASAAGSKRNGPQGKGTVFRIPAAGGTPEPLAQDRERPFHLTVLGDDVYWAEASGANRAPTRIVQLPKSGPPRVVVEKADADAILGITGDATRLIYLLKRAGGTVLVSIPR